MQNNLDELQSLIHFLRIKPYEDLNIWRDQITRPMNNGRGGLAIRRLQVYLKAFMKRRTKEVLKQAGVLKPGSEMESDKQKANGFKIVQRVVETIEADFSADERIFYARLEERADERLERMMASNKITYANALVLLLRLRQACNHPSLIQSDLVKEKDISAFTSGNQTPNRKKATTVDDIDSIASMLGGLSVETKLCDVCQIDLTTKEVSQAAVRCTDCQGDVDEQDAKARTKRDQRKAKTRERYATTERRKHIRRVVEDSDHEEVGTMPSGAGGGLNEEDEDAVLLSESEDSLSSDDDSRSPVNLVRSTKIRHLLSILKSDSSKNKYIVFSFFTSMLDLIEPFLRRDGLRYVRYDGKMRNDAREAALESLRNNDRTRILLCSLRAGSLGLNLTAACRVVILEPFWNPFVEEQAIDRVHRLNQTKDVKVYRLTVKDTVESRILELQDKKRELAAQTIEGKMGAGKLTLQDMLRLFRREAEVEHKVDGVGMRERGAALLKESDPMERIAPHAQALHQHFQQKLQIQPKKKEHDVYGRKW